MPSIGTRLAAKQIWVARLMLRRETLRSFKKQADLASAFQLFPRSRRANSSSLINHLQRELDLPRRSGSLADNAESAPPHNVRWQAEIHDVEQIKKLRSKLQRAQFPISAMPESSVFDQREIKVVIFRAAKCVAPQPAESPEIRPRTSRNIDRNIEERCIVRSPPEVVVAHRAAG